MVDDAKRNALYYASEKLGEAVQALATGEGDVRSRLAWASGSLALVSAGALPQALRSEYDAIWRELTKFKPKSKLGKKYSPVDLTLRKIKNSTGSKIALRIYSLNVALDSYLESLDEEQERCLGSGLVSHFRDRQLGVADDAEHTGVYRALDAFRPRPAFCLGLRRLALAGFGAGVLMSSGMAYPLASSKS